MKNSGPTQEAPSLITDFSQPWDNPDFSSLFKRSEMEPIKDTVQEVPVLESTSSYEVIGRAPLGAEDLDEPRRVQEILGWWVGRVTNINYAKKTFEAELADIDGIVSVADIDFRSVDEIHRNDIRVGGRFTYAIYREADLGITEGKTSLEFLPGYVYSSKDAHYIEKRLNELYGDSEEL